MLLHSFDTLEYAKGAEAVGTPKEQAEYQAQQIAKLVDYQIVTKGDIERLEHRLDSSIEKLEHKLDSSVENLNHKIEIFRHEIIIKLGSMMFVCSGLIIGILSFVMKH